MKPKNNDLLNKLKQYLEDDLSLSQDKTETRSADKNKRQRFITYLVFVATHPVKLESPLIPYNSSREDMVAYLMEIFSLNDNHLRKIVIAEKQRKEPESQKRSVEYFISRHIRTYSICLLYQIFLFASSIRKSKLKESLMFQSITLDNILYLPAYSLLNHHRLRVKLTLFEDRSLRRSAMLMILTRLDYQATSAERVKYRKAQIMLTSVAQNEYLVSRRSIEDLKTPDSHLDVIISLEYAVLSEFVDLILLPKLNQWFQDPQGAQSDEDQDKSMMFAALKLCKVAIRHFKKCKKSANVLDNSSKNILNLKSSIEVVLCQVILNHVGSSFSKVAASVTSRKNKTPKDSKDSIWFDLLRELRLINHDLCLHWSRKGLDGLITSEQDCVKKLKSLTSIEANALKLSIEAKIIDYLDG